MGQYYRGAVIRDSEIVPVEFDGAKLTEFSWLGDRSADALMRMLETEPGRVAIVGDYADDPRFAEWPQIREVYAMLWKWKVPGEDLEKLFSRRYSPEKKYLVNLDKQEYVDVKAYAKRCRQKQHENGRPDDDQWVASPLTLLTAAGNGLGGGDYHGTDEDLIGRWYMDTISVQDAPPGDGMQELECTFAENW